MDGYDRWRWRSNNGDVGYDMLSLKRAAYGVKYNQHIVRQPISVLELHNPHRECCFSQDIVFGLMQ
jgi:hypothetical protein